MIRLIQSILDALSERVKNPWLGSIFLAFTGINWQPLIYLFYANEDLTIRFDYFDTETDLCSLLLYPILLGFVLSAAKPILSIAYYWITKRPNQWNQSQFWQQKISKLEQKIEFEKTAQKLVKLYSKTEKITKSINDPDTQKEIKQTLREVRDGATSSSIVLPNLNAFFKSNNLPEKKVRDLIEGTALYLTKHKNTFTKDELNTALNDHNNWTKKKIKNRSKYWKLLIDDGVIEEKTTNNFKHRKITIN